MTFENVNFEWESERIAVAFGITTPLRFELGYPRSSQNPREDLFQKLEVDPLRGQLDDLLLRPRLENDIELVVTYFRDRKVFMIDSTGFETSYNRERNWDTLACIELDYEGFVTDYISHNDLSFPLAKGLFFLDLLTAEIEALLDITISTEQFAQWQMEYTPRMRLANLPYIVTGGFDGNLRFT